MVVKRITDGKFSPEIIFDEFSSLSIWDLCQIVISLVNLDSTRFSFFLISLFYKRAPELPTKKNAQISVFYHPS
jgi:hypothetical protein